MLLLRNEEIDSLLTGIDWRSLPTLSDIVTGRVKGRETDDQITGFVNNVGLGAQFIRAQRFSRSQSVVLGTKEQSCGSAGGVTEIENHRR